MSLRRRSWLPALGFCFTLPCAAADVANLSPVNVQRFLQTHSQAVIQFTSTDHNCGYCGPAADAAFDAAARHVSNGVSFARVKWAPWIQFPPEMRAMGIVAIPSQYAYRNGVSIDYSPGKMADPAAYAAKLNRLFATVGALPSASQSVAGREPPRAVDTLHPVEPSGPARRAPAVLTSAPGAGGYPVADCGQFMSITDRSSIPWNINGADASFCGQTALGFYPSDYWKAIAAFRDGVLVGLRAEQPPTPLRSWGIASPNELAPAISGHTETPGELWWALIGDARHVAVGQETHTRYLVALQHSDQRRAVELLIGKIQPPYPGSPEATYTMFDATPVTSARYTGGNGFVGNGTLKSAALTVTTRDPMQGRLSIEFEIEGLSWQFVLPMKRNVLEAWPRATTPPSELNQLVAGTIEGDAVVDCLDRPPTPGPRVACTMMEQQHWTKPLKMSYEAQVLFFGARSEFAVATFEVKDLIWTGPNGQRGSGTSKGLVVLRVSAP